MCAEQIVGGKNIVLYLHAILNIFALPFVTGNRRRDKMLFSYLDFVCMSFRK